MPVDTPNPSLARNLLFGLHDPSFPPMLYYELLMRILPGLAFLTLAAGILSAQQAAKLPDQPKPLPGKFTDATSAIGIRLQYQPSHTPKQYLRKTRGDGV